MAAKVLSLFLIVCSLHLARFLMYVHCVGMYLSMHGYLDKYWVDISKMYYLFHLFIKNIFLEDCVLLGLVLDARDSKPMLHSTRVAIQMWVKNGVIYRLCQSWNWVFYYLIKLTTFSPRISEISFLFSAWNIIFILILRFSIEYLKPK